MRKVNTVSLQAGEWELAGWRVPGLAAVALEDASYEQMDYAQLRVIVCRASRKLSWRVYPLGSSTPGLAGIADSL